MFFPEQTIVQNIETQHRISRNIAASSSFVLIMLCDNFDYIFQCNGIKPLFYCLSFETFSLFLIFFYITCQLIDFGTIFSSYFKQTKKMKKKHKCIEEKPKYKNQLSTLGLKTYIIGERKGLFRGKVFSAKISIAFVYCFNFEILQRSFFTHFKFFLMLKLK